MKPTTKQIQTLLNNLEFINLTYFESIGVPLDIENHELSLKEAVEHFIYIKELVSDAIEKDPVIFERVVLHAVRNNIITYLNTIKENSSSIKSNSSNPTVVRQIGVNLIFQIISLLNLINSINLDYYIKGTPNYQRKLTEINYLLKRFKELETSVKSMSKLENEIKQLHTTSVAEKENIIILAKQIGDTVNSVTAISIDIEKLYQTIKLNNTNIIEYATTSKQNSENITNFYTEIDGFKNSMTEGLKKIDDSILTNQEILNEKIKNFDDLANNSLKDFSNDTRHIIDTNANLQKTIYDILGKAIGTNLYKSFNEKAKSLKYISWGWLGLLTVSLIALTWIGYSVVNDLLSAKPGITLETSFFLRITVLFPILYAVYFFASLYKNTNKLQEEYDFKSAVSVSLHHFKDIIENTPESTETQRFLKESISNIFSSPTQLVYGNHKPDKDINDKVESTVEKIVNLASTLTSKKQ